MCFISTKAATYKEVKTMGFFNCSLFSLEKFFLNAKTKRVYHFCLQLTDTSYDFLLKIYLNIWGGTKRSSGPS